MRGSFSVLLFSHPSYHLPFEPNGVISGVRIDTRKPPGQVSLGHMPLDFPCGIARESLPSGECVVISLSA